MGNFGGHAIPGVFFIVYGLAWSILSLWYYITSSSPSQCRSKNSSCKACKMSVLRDIDLERKSWLPLCCCPRVPLEPIVKIVATILGILVEEFLGHNAEWIVWRMYTSHGTLGDQGNLQHITMYMTFLLSGIVDLMTIFLNLPKHTSKLFLSLAFFIEGFTFATHIGGRNSYNVLVHTLLTIVCFMCVFFSLMRLKTSSNVIVNLGFGNCIMLQGTWFIQVGYFLFTDFLVHQGRKQANEHHILQFMSEAFTWHILVIATSNLILWTILSLIARQRLIRGKTVNPDETLEEEMHHLMPDKNIEVDAI